MFFTTYKLSAEFFEKRTSEKYLAASVTKVGRNTLFSIKIKIILFIIQLKKCQYLYDILNFIKALYSLKVLLKK